MSEIGAFITDKGKAALRNDSVLEPRHRLILEIIARTGPCPMAMIAEIATDMATQFGGDADAAVTALKMGTVAVTWAPAK